MKSILLLSLLAAMSVNAQTGSGSGLYSTTPSSTQTAQSAIGSTPGAAQSTGIGTTGSISSTQAATSGIGSTPGASSALDTPSTTAGSALSAPFLTSPNATTTTNGTFNFDQNGNRSGPYYLDTTTTGAASTLNNTGTSASGTGVPMGATPTTATGVPMGATPTTGTGGTMGVSTLDQFCQSNPGADTCRNNLPQTNR